MPPSRFGQARLSFVRAASAPALVLTCKNKLWHWNIEDALQQEASPRAVTLPFALAGLSPDGKTLATWSEKIPQLRGQSANDGSPLEKGQPLELWTWRDFDPASLRQESSLRLLWDQRIAEPLRWLADGLAALEGDRVSFWHVDDRIPAATAAEATRSYLGRPWDKATVEDRYGWGVRSGKTFRLFRDSGLNALPPWWKWVEKLLYDVAGRMVFFGGIFLYWITMALGYILLQRFRKPEPAWREIGRQSVPAEQRDGLLAQVEACGFRWMRREAGIDQYERCALFKSWHGLFGLRPTRLEFAPGDNPRKDLDLRYSLGSIPGGYALWPVDRLALQWRLCQFESIVQSKASWNIRLALRGRRLILFLLMLFHDVLFPALLVPALLVSVGHPNAMFFRYLLVFLPLGVFGNTFGLEAITLGLTRLLTSPFRAVLTMDVARLNKWLLKPVTYVFLTLVAFYLGLVVYHRFDDPLAPGIERLLYVEPRNIPLEQDGYFYFLGFEAPAGADPFQTGVGMVKKAMPQLKMPWNVVSGRELLSERLQFEGELPKYLGPVNLNACFENTAEIAQLTKDNAILLERYVALQQYKAIYGGNLRMLKAYQIIPQYSSIQYIHQLFLANLALELGPPDKATPESIEKVLRKLSGDTAYWRQQLSVANSLIILVASVIIVDGNFNFASEIVHQYCLTEQHILLLQQFLSTPTDEEDNQIMKIVFSLNFMSPIDAAYIQFQDYLPKHMWIDISTTIDTIMAICLYPLYIVNNDVNFRYTFKAYYAIHRGYDSVEMPRPLPSNLGWHIFKNPFAKLILYTIALPRYQDLGNAFFQKCFDKSFLASLQLAIKVNNIAEKDIPAFLEHAPVWQRSPYREKTVLYDPASKQLKLGEAAVSLAGGCPAEQEREKMQERGKPR